MKNSFKWFVMLLVTGLAIYSVYVLETGDAERIIAWIRHYRLLGFITVLLFQTLLNMLPLPGEFTAIMVLEIYGPYWGGLCLWASGIIGAIGGYWLARSFTSYFAGTRVEPYLAKMEDWLRTSEFKGLLFARFVPFIPYHAVNYAAGLLRVNIIAYILTTSIGVFPHTVAMSVMYAGFRKGSLLWAVIGCMIFIILAGLSWYVKKRTSGKSQDSRVTAD
ncbi:TVP38/TMEM64 family protein [Paenibacillus sp. XY044]|uniref:TVP38/TMEM64 family protein n=1 Tax=Paenibacillus sp. XY044 TaxID=2026089 RepID=UPI000B98ACEA|nr:VTT domain-containing protein [Paenibacillus sp. XY044]OZB98779.1 hypothetical protein CJP46_06485 [Paenibacillus sp. XY044]